MSQNTITENQPKVDETVLALLKEADRIAAVAAASEARPTTEADDQEPADANAWGAARRAYLQLIDFAFGAATAHGVRQIVDTQTVIRVARHVASKKTRHMTDAQVLQFIASNDGFRRSLGGHLFEALDERNLKTIYNVRKWLGLREGRFLRLYPEHNRRGLVVLC